MEYKVGDKVRIIRGGYSGNTGKITQAGDSGYTIYLDNGMTVWFYRAIALELVK